MVTWPWPRMFGGGVPAFFGIDLRLQRDGRCEYLLQGDGSLAPYRFVRYPNHSKLSSKPPAG